jgi:hypothetical protein
MDLQHLGINSEGLGLEELNRVVNWLHSAGFHDAESALMREVESRFPDHSSPSRSTSAGVSPAADDHLSLTPSPQSPPKPNPTIDLSPPTHTTATLPVDATLASAEK